MIRNSRIKKELEMLQKSPPPGISCWTRCDDDLTHLEASIVGAPDTPFQDGIFKLDISIPERYPFEPPAIQFKTQIYHPNVDTAGRICLDILKMPPKGHWQPSINLSSVLLSIRLLMSEPNPDDPLMSDIAKVFSLDYNEFAKTAKEWTKKYAVI